MKWIKFEEGLSLWKTGLFQIFEHTIRHRLDLNDPILKIFLDAYQSDSTKGNISKIYKKLKKKAFDQIIK